MIIIKNKQQIEGIRKSCKLASDTLRLLAPYVKPGITTLELNDLAHVYIESQNAVPACLNYNGFPKSICTSINEVICHGIPGNETLKDGDIIKIDVTTVLDGYYGDTCQTFAVGTITPKAQKLINTTKAALLNAIKCVKPGAYFGNIGDAVVTYAYACGFAVVTQYCGHGVGLNFHEDPQISHVAMPGTGDRMRPGMIFTIEPMLNEGTYESMLLEDGWTAVTVDKKLSAQFEHTILVTDTGFEILTEF